MGSNIRKIISRHSSIPVTLERVKAHLGNIAIAATNLVSAAIIEMMENITDPRNPVPAREVPRLPVLKALTSVRLFAAMHVALYHLVRPFSLWGPLTAVISAGYVGVSFFFFLSGFILTYSHAAEYELGKGQPVKFWVARFARIYPVYLLSMIFAAYTGSVISVSQST